MVSSLAKRIVTIVRMPPDVFIRDFLYYCKMESLKRHPRFYSIQVSERLLRKITGAKKVNSPTKFFDISDRNSVLETIKTKYPDSINKEINQSTDLLNHNFNLLGSGRVNLGSEIDWHSDFKTGHSWDEKEIYLGTDNYINFDTKSDVKIPWELSRCQHFIMLGKAYWYTNDEKYAREFVSQVDDWIEQNLVGKGVNWACLMEVAIRAINWIVAYQFFKESLELSDDFRKRFLKSLYLHGKFLNKFLWIDEKGKENHYLSGLIGLIYIGLFFKDDNKEAKKWFNIGLQGMERELDIHINPDGVHYEGSIGYHRFVTELLSSIVILLNINNRDVPQKFLVKLEKMLDFINSYTKPDGMVPMISDADDGRLVKFSDVDMNDHRYLLNVGAVLLNNFNYKTSFPAFCEEAYWFLGDTLYKQFCDLSSGEIKKNVSRVFVDSGFYIMRHDDYYMFICGGHQKKHIKMGHLHNDTLSFELYAKGKSFIIDPGTYCYTSEPEWRDMFRSTSYHNTVVVDGIEQNFLDKDRIFGFKNFDAIAKLNRWETTNDYDLFDGEHYGYHKLENPVTHRRNIYFDKKERCWEITDTLTGKGKHKFEWYFHFAPMKIERDKENPLKIKTNTKGTNIEIIPEDVPDKMKCEVMDGWVSYGYGRKTRAPIVRYELNSKFEKKEIKYIIQVIV